MCVCVCRYLYQCCWSNSDNAGVGSCGCLREEELVVMLHDLQSGVPRRPALASGASQSSPGSTLEVVGARQPKPSRARAQSPRTRPGGGGVQTSASPLLHNTLTIKVKLLVCIWIRRWLLFFSWDSDRSWSQNLKRSLSEIEARSSESLTDTQTFKKSSILTTTARRLCRSQRYPYHHGESKRQGRVSKWFWPPSTYVGIIFHN